MKVTALIPYWLDYQKNEGQEHKNLKKLGNKYLIDYTISLLNSIPQIDETIVYCSNTKINDYINPNLEYTFLQRSEMLDKDDISIDDILEAFLDTVDTDVIVLLHPNSPFLSSKTVRECLSKVVSKEFMTSFTANKFKKLSWYNGQPLNYTLDKKTPHLRDLKEVIIEQSSLYIFTKEAFKKYNKRVDENPYIKHINHFEGLEVESKEDFEIAELIVNAGMYPKVEQ